MSQAESRIDWRGPRLFVDMTLATGVCIPLQRPQINYLGNVLRLGAEDQILVFNGREGEWRATLTGRKRLEGIVITAQNRPQDTLPDLHYVFAPLKHARLDYMAQKAVEMGAAALQPVLTQFTQVIRVNTERMRANVIEAAEQCGILSLATVQEPLSLERYLNQRSPDRHLIFCDEEAQTGDAAAALAALRDTAAQGVDVLVGPEGGFAEAERDSLLSQRQVTRLSLGPRILRADTAAVAALALVQTALGDWAKP